MSPKDANPFEQHVEKIALCVAFAALLGVAAWLYAGNPYMVTVSGKPMAISEVKPTIDERARGLADAIAGPHGKDFPPLPVSEKDVAEWQANAALPVVVRSGAIMDSGDSPIRRGTGEVSIASVYVPAPPQATRLAAQVGNVVLARTPNQPPSDRFYVSIEGQLDFAAWRQALSDSANHRPAGVDRLNETQVEQGAHVAGVYLVRERWDGRRFTDRQRVPAMEGQLCYDAASAGPDASIEANAPAAKDLVRQIMAKQAVITNPEFPALEPGSPLPPWGTRRANPADAESGIAAPASLGALDGPRAAAAPTGTAVVRAHDLTAEPGRRYRYKLCVSMLNPLYAFLGVSPAQLKDNATRVGLEPSATDVEAGPWVEVMVPSNLYAFCTQINSGKVRFSVYKTFNGQWEVMEFDVKPGQVIGDAFAVIPPKPPRTLPLPLDMDTRSVLLSIVDVPDPQRPERSIAAAVIMESDGTLTVRCPSTEVENPDWKRIQAAINSGGSKPAVVAPPPDAATPRPPSGSSGRPPGGPRGPADGPRPLTP